MDLKTDTLATDIIENVMWIGVGIVIGLVMGGMLVYGKDLFRVKG